MKTTYTVKLSDTCITIGTNQLTQVVDHALSAGDVDLSEMLVRVVNAPTPELCRYLLDLEEVLSEIVTADVKPNRKNQQRSKNAPRTGRNTISEFHKASSYRQVTGLSAKQTAVFEEIKALGHTSRRDLATSLGWTINRVVPRVNELMTQGLLVEVGTQFDPETNRNVTVIALALAPKSGAV